GIRDGHVTGVQTCALPILVHLTHLYLREMTARRRGDILILASTASFQAVPYISTYAATKAFDLLFAEGLAEEMKPYGIRVCALRSEERRVGKEWRCWCVGV